MKKQLILSVAILVSVLSRPQTSQCVGYFYAQSQAAISFCGGSEEGVLESIIDRGVFGRFQNLLIKLDENKEDFFSKKDLVEELSGYLKKFTSIKRFEVKDKPFYFQAYNCTYYYKEKDALHPNAEIGTKLMDLATTINWVSSSYHKPTHTREINLNFTGMYREALTLVITLTPTGDRMDIKNNDIKGVIAYITSNYQDDPQKRKFHIEKILVIDKMLRDLDSNPDVFINGPENIHNLVNTLWTLISAIDIYKIDQYGTKTVFSPNYTLVEKLLNIENQIDTLIKARQLEKSVVDTFAAICPYAVSFGL